MIGEVNEVIAFLKDQKPGKVWEVKEHKEKRSLSANSYFFVLVNKLAGRVKSSNTEVHNLMIQRYGQPDEDIKHIILRNDIDVLKLEGIHLKPTGHIKTLDDGKVYQVYTVMRGSHTYNTAEMSRLIDGIISECLEVGGIEVLPPEEIARLKSAYKNEGL